MRPELAEKKRAHRMKVLEDRVLSLLRQQGILSRADLYYICQSTKISSIWIGQKLLFNPRVSYERKGKAGYYIWLEQKGCTRGKASFKPCICGCGAMVKRDGVTFMCPRCRLKAAHVSPMAI